ncbi:MAG TPA: RDD family protein [Chitinophagaceae bacterium]|nr:RDD family protein [Chitinophagaceae bacterium]
MINLPEPHAVAPADKNVNTIMRLASMLMDQVFMGIISCLFWLPLLLSHLFSFFKKAFNSLPENIEPPVFSMSGPLFYVALVGTALYICKDSFNGRSIAKRILGTQVVSNKTGLPASPLQCLVRNLFCFLSLIEFIVALVYPARRIGDRVAGTRLADYHANAEQPKTNLFLVLLSLFIAYGFALLYMIPIKYMNSSFEKFINANKVVYVKTSYNPEASRALEELYNDKLGSQMTAEVRVYNTTNRPGLKYILIVGHLKRDMSGDGWDNSMEVLKGEVKEYLYSLYPKNTITGEARLVYSGDGTMSSTTFPIGR